MKKIRIKWNRVLLITFLFLICFACLAFANPTIPLPKVGLTVDTTTNPQEVSTSIQILLMLTVLSLAPSIIIMTTSFARIVIILSFLRNALGTQQMPPNQVLIGLALFMSLFIMNPVITDIYNNAYKPYSEGAITQQVAFEKATVPLKSFMLKQTAKKDLELFLKLSKNTEPINEKDVIKLPLTIIIPSFLISELTTAFKIGFLIFIPFLVIDMVVASTLMSMGMMMLPPIMISLPFKILLFVMVGGWNLTAQTIINSFVT